MTTAKTLFLTLLLAAAMGCGYSKPKTMTPAISSLNPASVSAGGAQFQLEVDGSNFASGAVVNFNGAPEATTVLSSTKLEATIPASAISTAETAMVTVTNPSSGGAYGMGAVTSTPMNFMIN
jgi:hypothetical protein